LLVFSLHKRPLTTNRHSPALTARTTNCTQQASIRQRPEPTPQTRIILQKLTVPQPVKKFLTLPTALGSEPAGQFSRNLLRMTPDDTTMPPQLPTPINNMYKGRTSEVGVTLVQQVSPKMICTSASPAVDRVSQHYCKALQPAPDFHSYPLLLGLLTN